jgi:hypothetical protein
MKAHGIKTNGANLKLASSRTRGVKSETHKYGRPVRPSKADKATAIATEHSTNEGGDGVVGNIKSEPSNGSVDKKFGMKVEGEDREGGLSMAESAHLMQYYESPYGQSQMGGDMDMSYGGESAYGGNSSGYATPIGYALGSHDLQHDAYYSGEHGMNSDSQI